MRTCPDQRQPWSVRSAFTLVEVLVVLAIGALLLGLGLPSYLDYGSNQRVRTAARTLASDLQAARQEALKRRATVTVRFSSADSSCEGAGRTASYTITQTAAPIKRTCLQRNVAWVSLPQGNLVFQSTGAVPAGMMLRLRSLRTGATHTVGVTAETGVITHDAR
ncbi:MAG: GspH/FimT family pseudopilin [bacterium]